MTHSLDLLTESMHLADPKLVQFGPTGLILSPHATDEELLSIGHRLMAVRSYLKWSVGSVLFEMAKRRKDDSWVSEFCTAHQIDPKDKREMVGVYEFYNTPDKTDTPPLSYEHHREAMWGASNGTPGARDRALIYLNRAHEQGLSYTQLRRAIRIDRATSTPEPTQPELSEYKVIFDFMRYTRTHLSTLHTYTPDRARLILQDLGESTLEFIDKLRALAAQ